MGPSQRRLLASPDGRLLVPVVLIAVPGAALLAVMITPASGPGALGNAGLALIACVPLVVLGAASLADGLRRRGRTIGGVSALPKRLAAVGFPLFLASLGMATAGSVDASGAGFVAVLTLVAFASTAIALVSFVGAVRRAHDA